MLPSAATAAKIGLIVLVAGGPASYSVAMCQWDCGWYAQAASHGYDAVPAAPGDIPQANWAFFPLFVALAAALAELFGISTEAACTLAGALSGTIGAGVAGLYLRVSRTGFRAASWAALVLALPTGLYLIVGLADSLFFLLSAAALLLLRRGAWLAAGVVIALAMATRPHGIVLLPLLAVPLLRRAWVAMRRASSWRSALAAGLEVALPLAVAPAGLSAFMVLLYLRTGDALAFSHVQRAWGRTLGNPVQRIIDGVRLADWSEVLDLTQQSYAVSASFALAALAMAALLAARGRLMEAWLCAATVVLAASTGLMSMPRIVTGNAGFVFGLFDVALLLPRRFARWVVLPAALVLEALVLRSWSHGAGFLT